MAGKRYTVMVIPANSSGTRRFSVARRTLFLFPVFLLVLIGVSAWTLYDRVQLLQRIQRLTPFVERSRAQHALLKTFNNRLKGVDEKLIRLRKLEEQLRIMASLKPRQKGTDLGIGGVSKEDLLDQMEGLSAGARRLAGRVSRQLLDLERRASGQQVVFQEIVRVFQGKRVLLAHTPSIWPVKGWVTSGFGRRTSVFTGRKMFHAGIDIVARKGTPILAPADGVVIKSGRESGYGKIIKVRHLQGIVTRYAHNHKNLVRVGQRVRRGQILGTVGSSGRSTGPHLHYEVRVNGVAVNPRLYILEVAVARR